MRSINRTALTKTHRGQWIALKSDRRTVIASGRSVKAVLAEAKNKGHKNPVVTRVPHSPASFVGPASR